MDRGHVRTTALIFCLPSIPTIRNPGLGWRRGRLRSHIVFYFAAPALPDVPPLALDLEVVPPLAAVVRDTPVDTVLA